MKQRYFRLPWSRLRRSARSLYREVVRELDDPQAVVSDRRLKRSQLKLALRRAA